MATNCKVKVAYLGSPWPDFNNFDAYSRVFKVSELIALVLKMIVHEGHSEKIILRVKFRENVSSEGFLLSHTRHNELIAHCIPLSNANNFIFIINICDA